ncbi:MAG: TetR family transcriptional regulator, partial [Actinomadura rubrobrunea]|nr:TetR family transcriptional regulator [Actinomadura rubrobrunea]
LETVRRATADVIDALAAEHGDYGAVQVRLILERPGLRARALQRLTDTQQELAELLTGLCPDLDEVDAVAAAGAAVGAMQAVIMHCRHNGLDAPATRAALDRALDVVEHGLRSVEALSRPADR